MENTMHSFSSDEKERVVKGKEVRERKRKKWVETFVC